MTPGGGGGGGGGGMTGNVEGGEPLPEKRERKNT